jgi:hypothetical protein
MPYGRLSPTVSSETYRCAQASSLMPPQAMQIMQSMQMLVKTPAQQLHHHTQEHVCLKLPAQSGCTVRAGKDTGRSCKPEATSAGPRRMRHMCTSISLRSIQPLTRPRVKIAETNTRSSQQAREPSHHEYLSEMEKGLSPSKGAQEGGRGRESAARWGLQGAPPTGHESCVLSMLTPQAAPVPRGTAATPRLRPHSRGPCRTTAGRSVALPAHPHVRLPPALSPSTPKAAQYGGSISTQFPCSPSGCPAAGTAAPTMTTTSRDPPITRDKYYGDTKAGAETSLVGPATQAEAKSSSSSSELIGYSEKLQAC